ADQPAGAAEDCQASAAEHRAGGQPLAELSQEAAGFVALGVRSPALRSAVREAPGIRAKGLDRRLEAVGVVAPEVGEGSRRAERRGRRLPGRWHRADGSRGPVPIRSPAPPAWA